MGGGGQRGTEERKSWGNEEREGEGGFEGVCGSQY